MATTANNSAGSTRQAALARRRALAAQGKAALKKAPGQAAPSRPAAPAQAPVQTQAGAPVARPAAQAPVGRAASLARRRAMAAKGKAGIATSDRVRSEVMRGAAKAAPRTASGCDCGCKKEGAGQQSAQAPAQPRPEPVRSSTPLRKPALQKVNMSPARAASLARRRALSARGKAGITGNGVSAAQTARAVNPQLSGRDLAKVLRAQRSQRGAAGEKRSAPVGRQRQRKDDKGDKGPDARWKVGVSETSHGQQVTGTIVGRGAKTTGDDVGVCRTVTGTEYLGADIFREFCQSEPPAGPAKVRVTSTLHGQHVTGTEVGRSPKVTGDEPGTCKRVTGTDYLSSEQLQQFCNTTPEGGPARVTTSHTARGKVVTVAGSERSEKVTGDEPGAARTLTGTQYPTPGNGRPHPQKVGVSQTLHGGQVTGALVGRSRKVTGDEPGTCKRVTGDDYVGAEQYQALCGEVPEPQEQKVGVSQTFKGKVVTGTMASHSPKITGDEPGLCKVVTGTPYAGAEQYRAYCDPETAEAAAARARPLRATPGPVATGTQPGVDGRMTGAERGACEPVTGTPYLGADQYAAACPSTAAEPGSPDFPQVLAAPAAAFTVAVPVHASQAPRTRARVTGSEGGSGHITGPFSRASGKVTGTEEARFGRPSTAEPVIPEPQPEVEGRPKGRITGEGMEAGPRITGDDWARGDRVTGTEGSSAMRRNPTRRGSRATSVMPPPKRNEELPEPSTKVTGGSGKEDQKGPLVTYSGGARG